MMNLCGLLLTIAVATGPTNPLDQPAGERMMITASIDADALEIGKEYEIVINATFAQGASTSASGVPAPILQVHSPKSISLSGKTLIQFKDLARNEFLQAPYERLLNEFPARIKFKLKKRPAKTEQIEFNVLAYVRASDRDYFVRQRFALPVKAGAVSTAMDSSQSKWGKDKTLQLGDKAAPFSLPRADGTILSLGKILGKQNIIITTYRAHW